MSLYPGSIVINVTDLKKAIAFWTAALSYEVRNEDDDFVVLHDPICQWVNLSLQLTDKPKESLNRLHLDLYTTRQQAEVKRLEGLGATSIPWNYEPDADFVVMTDPDGNEFCVIQTDQAQI